MNYNYQYFSGANVVVENQQGDRISECAGISYSISNSRQPVYGYNSEYFDVMLPGRMIVQGTIVVNQTRKNYLEDSLKTNLANGESFNIRIRFGNNRSNVQVLVDCALISSGKTIQVSEQVILEEYGFIAKNII